MSTNEQGQRAETFALSLLQKNGYQLLHRNYHCRYGEIDLVVSKKQLVVFVEVRYRKNLNYGGAIESVTWHKQQKIIKTAEHYIHQHTNPELDLDYRFDVIALSSLSSTTNNHEWIENAW